MEYIKTIGCITPYTPLYLITARLCVVCKHNDAKRVPQVEMRNIILVEMWKYHDLFECNSLRKYFALYWRINGQFAFFFRVYQSTTIVNISYNFGRCFHIGWAFREICKYMRVSKDINIGLKKTEISNGQICWFAITDTYKFVQLPLVYRKKNQTTKIKYYL